MLKNLVIGMTFLLSTNVFASTECIPQTEMQQIAQNFSQFAPYANAEFCLDGSEISNLLEALVFMKLTPFESNMTPSTDELFSGRFQNDWYGYFTQRIKTIEIDRGCPKGVGAYVYGFFTDTMYVCTMLLTTDFTGLDRASIFMHEARHMDGFPHTTCSQGARAGVRGACDRRISEGGSYAVSVETYAQLSKYAPNLHPALRAYAKASAITYADEAFDTPVRVEREPALLLMAADKSLHHISSRETNVVDVEARGETPALGKIAMRGSLMVLFPEDKNLTAEFLFADNAGLIQQQAGPLAGEYNASTPQERSQVIDTHMGGGWSVQVKGGSLEFMCDRSSDAKQNRSLDGQTAVGFLYPNGYSKALRNVTLALADGRYLDVGCQGTQGYARESTFVSDLNLKRVYKMGEMTFGLGQDLKLYSLNGSQANAVSVPGVPSIYEIAPIETLSFFDQTNGLFY